MIEPSIGRKLWYHPDSRRGDPPPIKAEQPYDASVVCVYSERELSLAVWDHEGNMFPRRNVRLAQDDDIVEPGMAQWMPFQVGQAKRHEASDRGANEVGGDPNLLRLFTSLESRVGSVEGKADKHEALLQMHNMVGNVGTSATEVDQGKVEAAPAESTVRDQGGPLSDDAHPDREEELRNQ